MKASQSTDSVLREIWHQGQIVRRARPLGPLTTDSASGYDHIIRSG